ncbi:MAG: lytic transglycosylase domain-containing protein [Burkholderiales bacterium]|nr:lytic transglycosylase domain-containing protein [Burkholderiales bacterium]
MRAATLRIGFFCAERSARRASVCTLLAVALLFALAPARAQSDDDFLAVREAFRTGNRARLDAIEPRLRSHVLYPYVAYYQMRQRLDEAPADDVRALMVQLSDGPLAERLRNDWLKSAARRGLWDEFDADRAGLRSEDAEVTCYALQRSIRLGEAGALQAVRTHWLSSRRAVPEACNTAYQSALAAGAISADDVWARIRLTLQYGQVSVAKSLDRYLPGRAGLNARQLDAAAANPRKFLEARGAAPKAHGAREIVLFAIQRLARTSPQEAAARFRTLAPDLAREDREFVWGRLAYYAALFHDPEALDWFARAGELNDDQLEWRARAALRTQAWDELLGAVGSMSEARQAEPEWRYWKARALAVQGKQAEANALLAPLSTEHHFYGLLAAEELGETIGAPSEAYRPSESDIQTIADMGAIRRALALYRLNLRFEGNREWLWAIRDFDDRQLLAAAEYARRNELWDRAINTAERTRSVHDFGLRYLAPYREQFRAYAAENGLDEAWVFGLVRQESRFIADARSSAGAMGLMQLMPATARWVAGKLGLKGFRPATVTDLDINISLGTYYLRHVLDVLDNQAVLASAGYNAGPGRARAWRSDGPMEAAIYTETIPFNETRDYVKKVMTNAAYYARMFGRGVVSLKERLGTIPPRHDR